MKNLSVPSSMVVFLFAGCETNPLSMNAKLD